MNKVSSLPFISILALIFLICAAVYKYKSQSEFSYLFGSSATLIFLFLSSLRLRKNKATGFDVLVASETIIAFGIVSLVLGLVVGVYQAMSIDEESIVFSTATIRILASPFVEGLFTAALAPVLAMVLRQINHADTVASGVTGGDPVTMTADLTNDFKELADQIKSATHEMNALCGVIANSANDYKTALGRVNSALMGLGSTVEGEIDPLKSALSGGSKELEEFRKGISSGKGMFDDLQDSSKKTSETLSEMNKATKEGTDLLKGLAKIIESIENFIKPDPKT